MVTDDADADAEYDDLTERRIDRAAVGDDRRRPVRRKAGAGRQTLGASAFAGAIALGLQEVFEPVEREEIVQIVDTGEPDPDAPVDLLLVKDAPRRSRARVRPWLLDRPPVDPDEIPS